MKKFLMAACMMLMSVAAFAQQGETAVGVNLNYGMHSDYKNFGLGAKVQYEFIDNVRAEAAFNYFFKKDNLSQWEVDLNVHYLFPIGGVKIYPLAGLSLLNSKVSYKGFSSSDSDFGLNLGGGVEFPIAEKLKANAEVKYQIVNDFDRPVISVGVAYSL